MIISEQQQDTIKQNPVRITKKPSLSLTEVLKEPADTTSVCIRNPIADVTFYDPGNLTVRLSTSPSNGFPFVFLEKNIANENYKKILLVKHLKEGARLPVRPFHDNWIILLILSGAFLFSAISTFSKKLFPDTVRFFMFRRTGDTSTRDKGSLFVWQSTLLNLISFINLALFGYYAAFFYGIIPSGIPGFVFWLICIGIVIAAITLRHITCLTTGIISGQRELFREYLQSVYLFYRYSALIAFVLIILMTFTFFSPAKFFFIAGLSVITLLYIIRIIRLLIIFLTRNISIFYFILYLCALEILPAMVLVKYLTGII
ncbi:MAG: DUF4271 domain-containing protein [Bacteroidales bacterium]|nr:DUF4271 domain-containing protein [Bacteroidales bacterium]